MLTISLPGTIRDFHSLPLDTWMRLWRLSTRPHRQRLNIPKCSGMHRGTYRGEAMRRCADLVDCGHENRDSDLFCRACALPLLGTALAGRYVVEALISKGGYAAVFRGVDQNLSRRIAIKVLLPSKTTPNEQEHFIREARIAATLDHPNIAPILDYGIDGPSVFLVMPLYTAGTLRTRLAFVNGPLPAAETIHDFHQLASALHYAHTRPRPVIHRDN